MIQEDQKDCKNNTRAEEKQVIAAETKQHEDEEQGAGKRPAGRENKGKKKETRQNEQNKLAGQQVPLLPLSRSPH